MKKSDLKIGYLLECRNGKIKMLMPTIEANVLVDQDGFWFGSDNLNDDLTFKNNVGFDIIKVYGFSRYANKALGFETDTRELLWERDKKEMTIAQIEKELGYSIRIVKD